MGEVPRDRVRAPFLAVGDWNGNVKILGLSPENLLEQVKWCRLVARCQAVPLLILMALKAVAIAFGWL